MAKTAKAFLDVARGWVGRKESDGSFKEILDVYNSHKPLARGYAIKYTDEWCDAFVSAVAIKAKMTDLIGTEVGCEKHVDIFKKLGIWIEDGSITPKAGDIIVYNWNDKTQPNDGWSDHIGIVEEVKNGKITTIEGNVDCAVKRRTIAVGYGQIRGFARPKYEAEPKPEPKPAPKPEPTTGIKLGDSVTFKGGPVYVSSTAKTAAGKKGKATCQVTGIAIGAPHPYHCIGGSVYGWVDAKDIKLAKADKPGETKPAPKPESDFKIGDKVKATSNAVWVSTGKKIPLWLRVMTLYIRSEVSNGTVVVSWLKTGAISGRTYVKDLKRV